MRRSRPRPPPGPPWRRSAGRSAWRPRRWAGSCPATRTGGGGHEPRWTRARRAARRQRAPPGRDRTRAWVGADCGGGVAAGADRRRGAVRLIYRPVHLYPRRPPAGRGQRDRGAAAGPVDDRVHAARARPVPGGPVRPGRAGPHPSMRGRVVVHERVRRRRGQPPVSRSVRGRAGRAGRGSGPGRGGRRAGSAGAGLLVLLQRAGRLAAGRLVHHLRLAATGVQADSLCHEPGVDHGRGVRALLAVRSPARRGRRPVRPQASHAGQ